MGAKIIYMVYLPRDGMMLVFSHPFINHSITGGG